MRKNDGGPAFPVRDSWWEENEQKFIGYTGMSLRDFFAAAALSGLLTSGSMTKTEFAQEAYLLADAMLKEREKSDE